MKSHHKQKHSVAAMIFGLLILIVGASVYAMMAQPNDGGAIKTTLLNFYSSYNAQLINFSRAANADTPASQPWQHLQANPYLTAALSARLAATPPAEDDPVLCAEIVTVNAFTVDHIASDGNNGSATVHQNFGSSSEGATEIRTTLIKAGGRWKIDGIDCQPSKI